MRTPLRPLALLALCACASADRGPTSRTEASEPSISNTADRSNAATVDAPAAEEVAATAASARRPDATPCCCTADIHEPVDFPYARTWTSRADECVEPASEALIRGQCIGWSFCGLTQDTAPSAVPSRIRKIGGDECCCAHLVPNGDIVGEAFDVVTLAECASRQEARCTERHWCDG